MTTTEKTARIGIFTYDFSPWEGGMGRHVSEIASYMRKRPDIEILIFSPCRNNTENHFPLFTFTKKIGKNVLFSLLLNFHLHRIIEKYRLDILHLHSGSGGLFLYRKPGKKVIVTTHTNTYLHQFRLSKKFIKLLLSPLEKYTYILADYIVSVSSFVKKNIIDDYLIFPDKIQIIPNGVQTSTFNENVSIEKLEKTVLFAGRIDKNKGLEFLINSLELVHKKHRDLQLLIAGVGNYKKSVRHFLENKEITSNIHFLGWQNDQTLHQLYNQVTLFVLPSMSEGFPLTILEAMSCSCPVIATDSGGTGDIIRDGINGFLINYGDIEHLAAIIDELFMDQGKRKKLGRKGKETVIGRFCWDAIAARYMALYISSK